MPDLNNMSRIFSKIRNRLLFHIFFACLFFILAFEYSSKILSILEDLLLPDNATLIYIRPAEYLMIRIKFAGYSAIISFVFTTGLHGLFSLKSINDNFQMSVLRLSSFFTFSLTLFLAGCYYALFITLPLVLNYLHNDALSAGIDSTYSLSEFYSFIMILTFALGLTFQLPLIMFVIVKANLATVETLKSYRPHLIVSFFLFSALITPPDVISQFLLAIPLIILYELSLFIVRFLE
ncbi:MAG: hypothetical protein BEU04_02655 [Marine Group III euryarchaeote CG-Bathy1]|uniref:Sec-independent protein translocase protein TatC n=2 Tax=Methanobacteriati TaxID=3366610 RepID=A0A075FUC5_9EURY|nr:putative sec-independent translocase protein (tatC) [uncultured marine group II/III euryarchaeote AD1000_61_A07]OIR14792.1 MAG: hypothetical protein BEU04_02655 [Marine Group III euryarchaeote CG-Bathy1]